MQKDCENKNISVDVSNLKKGEKLVYNYDDKGRVSEISRQESSSCWVVTAYYGHPYHSNVCSIRELRENLIGNNYFGFLFRFINNLYLYIGQTKFSNWWVKKVEEDRLSIPYKISKKLCEFLLKIPKSTKN